MDDREFRRLYSRATRYGFTIPQAQLIKNVLFEDKERFKQALKQVTYTCPECAKTHNFSEKDIQTIVGSSMAKSIGRFGFTGVCPSSEVLLSIDLNARGNNFLSTPIYDIQKENIKIEVRSLNRLRFESEDFKNLSAVQLNKIISYHKNKEGSYSENVVTKALGELQLRELEAPKPEVAVPKRKSLLSKVKGVLVRVKGALRN